MSNLVLPFLIPPNFQDLRLHPERLLWIKSRHLERLAVGYSTGEIAIFTFRLYKQRRLHCHLAPKLLLLPDILAPQKPVLDLATIPSKNPHVLNTSEQLLLSLHADNQLRLWNIEDGKCIAASRVDLFSQTILSLKIQAPKHLPPSPTAMTSYDSDQQVEQKPSDQVLLYCFARWHDIFVVDPYKLMILYILKGPFQNVVTTYLSPSLRLVLLDAQSYLLTWPLDQGFSESNNAHYKVDTQNVVQCQSKDLFKLAVPASLGKPIDFIFSESAQIFSEIQFVVIYETGVALVHRTGQVRAVLPYKDKCKFQDKLSQKIALKTGPNHFQAFYLSAYRQVLWLRVSQDKGQMRLKCRIVRQLGFGLPALFSPLLAYNILTALKLEGGELTIWDIAPLLAPEAQDGEPLPSTTTHLRLFPKAAKAGQSPPFRVNPAMYLYLQSEMSELVFNLLYLGQTLCTSLCIYDGVSTPFQVVGTSYGRIFIFPLFQLAETELPVVCELLTRRKVGENAKITSLSFYNSQLLALAADSSLFVAHFSHQRYMRELERFQSSVRRGRSEFEMKRLSRQLQRFKKSRTSHHRHSYDFSLSDIQVLPSAFQCFRIPVDIVYK